MLKTSPRAHQKSSEVTFIVFKVKGDRFIAQTYKDKDILADRKLYLNLKSVTKDEKRWQTSDRNVARCFRISAPSQVTSWENLLSSAELTKGLKAWLKCDHTNSQNHKAVTGRPNVCESETSPKRLPASHISNQH